MTSEQPSLRLIQVLGVLDREAELLSDVADRLFAGARLDAAWLHGLIATPDGADRLESFVGKFSRMQDNLVDKFIPLLIVAVGDKAGAAIDNLNLIERWGFLADVPRWLGMRRLRNRLVHEYLEHTTDLENALVEAKAFTAELLETYRKLREFAQQRMALLRSVKANEDHHV